MKQSLLVGALMAALAMPVAQLSAQSGAAMALATINLTHKAMADGKPLAPGTYQVRLTNDMPKPGLGQSPDGERYVEFVKNGQVVAREVATVVPNAEIRTIAKEAPPASGSAK